MLESRMLGLVPAWAFLVFVFILALGCFLNPSAYALDDAGKQLVSNNKWLFRWVIAFPIMLVCLYFLFLELFASGST